MIDRVGIRELRDRVSEVMRQVQSGQEVEVTDNGRPVARIVPIRPVSPTERLRAEGVLLPARNLGKAWQPRPMKPGQQPMSKIIAELRADER